MNGNRKRVFADLRKCVIKAVKDKHPKCSYRAIGKAIGCTANGVKFNYVLANIFYSNDEKFQKLYDNFIK